MQLHPRHQVVQQARTALAKALVKWTSEHMDITFGEELSIVQGEMGSYIGGMAKYEIRRERHGNEETPGGLVATEDGPT